MQENYYDKKVLKKLQRVELGILKDFDTICKKNNLEYFLVGGSAIGVVRHSGFIPWDDDIDVGMSREDYESFLKIADSEYSSKYTIVNHEKNKYFPLMTTRWGLNGTEYITDDLKNIPGEFGIFLDIYCFDNISDNDIKMKIQGTLAWFYGKLMILYSVKKPTLYYYGLKAKALHFIFYFVHYILRIIPFGMWLFYHRAYYWTTKYRGVKTKRFAYMFDPKRFTSIVNKDDVYPIKRMKFEKVDVMVFNNIDKYLKNRYGIDYMELPPVDKRHTHLPFRLSFDSKKNME